jgi:predicted ester cyclase
VSQEQNKLIVRQWIDEVVNENDLSAAHELATAEEVTVHRRVSSNVRSAFPDVQLTIQSIIAEHDHVVVFWHASGTHQGPWRGIAPTGKRVVWEGTTWYEVVAGRIEGEWTTWNRLDMYEQLVGLPNWFQN